MAETREVSDSVWNYEDEEDNLDNVDDEGTGNEKGSDSDSDGEELDPKLIAKLQKLMEAREVELAAAIESGDTKNGVYKGLQKSIGKKDREIDDLRGQLREALDRFDRYEGNMEDIVEGLNWSSETLLGALPEDDQKSAKLALQERRVKLRTTQLEKKTSAPAPEKRQESQSTEQPAWVTERIAKFVTGRQAAAVRAGVKADDPDLDYGTDEDGLVERLDKFDESLVKLLAKGDDQRIEGVRKRTEPVGTRSSGGGVPAVANNSGKSRLELASQERLKAIRGGSFGR